MTAPAGSTPDPLLLPEGARLLHIGPPKTGTTALQTRVQAVRRELDQYGVLYPGRGRNHRREVFALMGRVEARMRRPGGTFLDPGATREELERVPPIEAWQRLMAEIAEKPSHRALISNEGAAACDDEQARRFVDELGADRIHVVITLRPRTAILPSSWIEGLKVGFRGTFRSWLKHSFGIDGKRLSDAAMRYLDQGTLVQRWATAAGPENVTVVILDPANRAQLTQTFERMLGLPPSMLAEVKSDKLYSNRSMTLPEATMVRRLNSAVDPREGDSWPAFLNIITNGAVTYLLSHRVPPTDEPKVSLPDWAQKRALKAALEDIEKIRASGVRVIGDLDILLDEGKVETELHKNFDRPESPVPVSAAVHALTGAYYGGLDLERATLASYPRGWRDPATIGGRELLRLLVKRIAKRVRGRGPTPPDQK